MPFADAEGVEEVLLGEEKVTGLVVWRNATFVCPEEAESAAIQLRAECLPGDLGEERAGDSAAGKRDGKRTIFTADKLNPPLGNRRRQFARRGKGVYRATVRFPDSSRRRLFALGVQHISG